MHKLNEIDIKIDIKNSLEYKNKKKLIIENIKKKIDYEDKKLDIDIKNLVKSISSIFVIPIIIYIFYWYFIMIRYNNTLKNKIIKKSALTILGYIYTFILNISIITILIPYIIENVKNHILSKKYKIKNEKNEKNERYNLDCNDFCNIGGTRGDKYFFYLLCLFFVIFMPLFAKLIFLDAEIIFESYGVNTTNFKKEGFTYVLAQYSGDFPKNIYSAANSYAQARDDLLLILILTFLLAICILSCNKGSIEKSSDIALASILLASIGNWIIISIRLNHDCYKITNHFLYKGITQSTSLLIIFQPIFSILYLLFTNIVMQYSKSKIINIVFNSTKIKYDELEKEKEKRINSLG